MIAVDADKMQEVAMKITLLVAPNQYSNAQLYWFITTEMIFITLIEFTHYHLFNETKLH